jgi:nicotinamide mononucleotide transporter
MLSRKLLENWWAWMTADVIYVALYSYKNLYLTAVLYLLFLGMCVAGYTRWRKLFAIRQPSVAQEVVTL